MKASEVFVRRDVRRGKAVIQPMGWVALALVLILVATIGAACWQQCSGPDIGPTATATTAPTPSATSDVPTPSYTPIVHEDCPSNPALWTLVPYDLPGREEPLYMINPPCVMDSVEQAWLEFRDARADHGRYWTIEDSQYHTYWEGSVIAPITERVLPAPSAETWVRTCSEVLGEDGQPLISYGDRLIFYAAGQDKTVAVLLVLMGGFPATTRTYDCETGEVTAEEYGTGGTKAYVVMAYNEAAGRWQRVSGVEWYEEMTAVDMAEDSTIAVVRQVQSEAGR